MRSTFPRNFQRTLYETIEVATSRTNRWRMKRRVATHLSCVNARYSNSRVNRAWRVEQDFLGSLGDRKGTRRRISVALPPAQKIIKRSLIIVQRSKDYRHVPWLFP